MTSWREIIYDEAQHPLEIEIVPVDNSSKRVKYVSEAADQVVLKTIENLRESLPRDLYKITDQQVNTKITDSLEPRITGYRIEIAPTPANGAVLQERMSDVSNRFEDALIDACLTSGVHPKSPMPGFDKLTTEQMQEFITDTLGIGITISPVQKIQKVK
jgi:hypothetical protein